MPGGTVLKNEAQTEAVHRVAKEELGEPIVIDECLCTYEHFYEAYGIMGVDSKQYGATAYCCDLDHDKPGLFGDEQHSALNLFHPPLNNLNQNILTSKIVLGLPSNIAHEPPS
ncbi:hypothetical protein [Haloarcula sp. 1CSR25-25]|uniref:hypothetical protein n=1 Tax=Haloarcula sp. 1CSR25-25 TaxID=2862545 RepID=UPI00289FF566|nr:hypothetical protein [Haloarcula sp. 1CSR25-25]